MLQNIHQWNMTTRQDFVATHTYHVLSTTPQPVKSKVFISIFDWSDQINKMKTANISPYQLSAEHQEPLWYLWCDKSCERLSNKVVGSIHLAAFQNSCVIINR